LVKHGLVVFDRQGASPAPPARGELKNHMASLWSAFRLNPTHPSSFQRAQRASEPARRGIHRIEGGRAIATPRLPGVERDLGDKPSRPISASAEQPEASQGLAVHRSAGRNNAFVLDLRF